MSTSKNTAEIIDLSAYRQQAAPAMGVESQTARAFLMWYPVWVVIPQPFMPQF